MTSAAYSQPMANAIRALSMDAVQAANSGHPGMPMGMADVATVLFTGHLKFDPKNADWADRDRFVLSAGHGSMLLYSLLHLTGYEDMDMNQLRNFRQLDSRCAGHPEFGEAAGIEMTTGPLGQGIATAVGMALAERMLNARHGDNLVDHHTYAIVGDGCLMEGVSQEAISLAGHLNLSRMIVLWDDNEITIDGATGLSTSENMGKRFEAAGWDMIAVDGHDMAAVDTAIAKAKTTNKPSLIACKTVIGKGSPNKQGTSATHGAPLGPDEIALTRAELNWTAEPFVIPDDILAPWRAAGARCADEFSAWNARLDAAADKATFVAAMAGELPDGFAGAMDDYKKQLAADKPAPATRKASQMALEVINAAVAQTAGGSADLTGSNLTKT
ncbi:MAG: 1-deoxy-D-xylulose-5-phosphate synthase N-terminal domain-containing protein, partial [Amylibacter sp.]